MCKLSMMRFGVKMGILENRAFVFKLWGFYLEF